MKQFQKMSEKEFEETKCFIKHNVELNEYRMHKLIYNSGIINVPKIYRYDKKNKIMVMQKINNMNMADEYGENPEDVPSHMLTLMQDIIKKLYYFNVEYPDITGYNFIFYDNKMYIIDFEHSKIFTTNSMKNVDPFIKKFINGACEWNPNYL